ncbi:MAG TPA: sporulation integral membrane protein YtvI [Clostridiales bacterium]|nr:sporulation integral membrane protein YtvI [Clostridiales bacterium]
MNAKYAEILKRLGIFVLVVISVVGGVLLAVRLALFLMPFLIAFALSSLMEPLIRVLDSKLRINRKISAPIILLLLMAIIVTLVVLGILRLIDEIRVLIASAPAFFSSLYREISELMAKGAEHIDWLPVEITDNLGSIIANLSNTVTNFGKTLVKGAYVTALSLPEVIMFTIVTILGTYFMAKDRHAITAVLRRHLPEDWVTRIRSIKNDLFMAIFGYLRAALIMMAITFTELLIGLTIIRARYTLLLAFLIAVIDALPILGTGSVLIPWSLYSLVTGDIRMGVSVFVLYLVILVIRQFVEPKVVGQQIGVHPLLTLLAMYTGLKLLGFPGMILGPITFILIRNILVTIFRKKPIKDIIGFDSVMSDTGSVSSGVDRHGIGTADTMRDGQGSGNAKTAESKTSPGMSGTTNAMPRTGRTVKGKKLSGSDPGN